MAEQKVKEQTDYQVDFHHMQKDLLAGWMRDLERAAENNEPTVYTLVAGSNLSPIFRCLGIHEVYPELTALQLGIRKKALPFIQVAEEMGYSTDVCGYVKADIGNFFSGNISAAGTQLPKPTLLLSVFSGCNVYIKWWEQLAAYTGAPLYVIDAPFVREGEEPTAEDIHYVVEQLKEAIVILEKISGKKLDYDELRERLVLAREMEKTWFEIKDLLRNIPAPYDAFFDGTILMGPLVSFRGTPEGVKFFHAVLQKMRERVKLGIGPLPEERFRIVMEGTPPYPSYKAFRDLFSKWGAVAVGATYTTAQPLDFLHDPDRPLESMAEYPLRMFTNRGLTQRYEMLRQYATENSADGLVIHSVKSCRLFSVGHGDMRRYFSTELGIPTLMLESDLVDSRYFAEAQIRNRVDAFFEVLEHKKYFSGAAAKQKGA